MHSPMQRKYVTNVTHGARTSRGERDSPYSIMHY